MRQRRAIRAVQPPGRTPFVVPQRWLAPRQFHGGRVIISNHAISIGCIDSCRQRLQHIAEVLLAVTPLLLGAFKIGCPAFECLIDAGKDGNILEATHYACKFTILIESSEEHTYELQSLMRIPYAVFC